MMDSDDLTRALNNGITAGCCGAVAGGLIYLKVKGSLPMAVFRMSSSCFSFASVYTFTSQEAQRNHQYSAWQRGAAAGSLSGLAFGAMHSSLPSVAIACALAGSVGAGIVEGSLQAARDTRRALVLARHGESVEPSPSRWAWLLDYDMPVWVPVRSEEKCEQHRQLACDIAALRAERQQLLQVVRDAKSEA
eukprot:m.263602 g.263602  ORF g.263602 m.263602 type:complete len:191 (-) comp17613_c0_seq8:190-762(-)